MSDPLQKNDHSGSSVSCSENSSDKEIVQNPLNSSSPKPASSKSKSKPKKSSSLSIKSNKDDDNIQPVPATIEEEKEC